MNVIISEVRNTLLNQLSPLFAGFRLIDEDDDPRFVRSIAAGRQEISVALADYDPIYVFSLVMCIRLDEVERIANRFFETPPQYVELSVTSMTQLAYFFPDQQGHKEYRVSSADDIANAVRELSAVKERILRFFDEHQDVEALDTAMNSQEDPGFDISNQPYRAMHGVIVAHVAKTGKFEETVARYREEVRDWPDAARGEFDRLILYLRESPHV